MNDLMKPVAWIVEDQFGERLEWDGHVGWGNLKFALYTADQMREYAKKAVETEREACAKVCDRAVGGTHPDDIHSDGQWAALTLAEEIRARSNT